MILFWQSTPESTAAQWRWIHDRWPEHGLPERCECPQCKSIETTHEEATDDPA